MAWTPPPKPKIYHIAHTDRLSSIIKHGLWCDATMAPLIGFGTIIGMTDIKARRLTLPISCYPNTFVGGYVPFYFCPRSVMLYLLHRGNHPGLSYTGGQEPILHFEADLQTTVQWANSLGVKWAFALSNAATRYTEFRNDLRHLEDVNWPAVSANDFRSPEVKEGKQAEFLVHNSFPWPLIERIGVRSQAIGLQVTRLLTGVAHRPEVRVVPGWYY